MRSLLMSFIWSYMWLLQHSSILICLNHDRNFFFLLRWPWRMAHFCLKILINLRKKLFLYLLLLVKVLRLKRLNLGRQPVYLFFFRASFNLRFLSINLNQLFQILRSQLFNFFQIFSLILIYRGFFYLVAVFDSL